MKDEQKTRQLVNEIIGLRRKIAKLQFNKNKYKAEKVLHHETAYNVKHEAVITALSNVARALLACNNFDETSLKIVKICKELIGANDGYIIFLGMEGAENCVIFLNSCIRSCSLDTDFPLPIKGLNSEVHRTGEAIYHNNFSGFEWIDPLTDGHMTIENILITPVSMNAKIKALFGLTNKTGGFNEDDLRIAAIFAENIAIAFSRKNDNVLVQNLEERFYSLTASSKDAIVCSDSNGMIIFWNKAAEAKFGYIMDEIIGKPTFLLMPERFRLDHQDGLKMFALRGYGERLNKPVELTGLRQNGLEFPVEISLSTWKTEEGLFYSAIIRDLTEEKRIQSEIQKRCSEIEQGYIKKTNELQEINEQLRNEINNLVEMKRLFAANKDNQQSILDSASVCIFLKDIDGKYVFVNKRCENKLNLRKEILIGKTDYHLYPLEIANTLADWDSIVAEERRDIVFEEMVEVNKEERYYLTVKFPLFDSQEVFCGIGGISTDITERKIAENELRTLERRYHEFMEGINAIVWEAKPVTKHFTFVNPKAEEISGFPVDTWLNEPDFSENHLHPDDREEILSFYRNLKIKKGKNYECEYRMIKADGTTI